jgi:competence ComEA-like helix-hairpin-helix protein
LQFRVFFYRIEKVSRGQETTGMSRISGNTIVTVRLRRPVTLVILAGTLTAAVTAHLDGTQDQSDDAGSQTFTTVCGRCHPIERVTVNRRSRSQWEETITTMITARGAQISDEDFDTVLTYLTRVYGRVDINRAAADDITEVLAIPESMAGAIVAYRSEHGRFEDFEALAKVPGIDRAALEKRREAIAF